MRQARAVYSADAKIWGERLDDYPSCQEEAIFEMNENAGRIKDEFAINGLLEALTKALHDKKARALIALLANDAVAFDLAPPLQLGPNVMHDPAPLEEWFATWRGPNSFRTFLPNHRRRRRCSLRLRVAAHDWDKGRWRER